MKTSSNWIVKDYHNNSGQQYEAAINIITTAIDDGIISFNGDEYVLDIGCGSGKITSDLAKTIFTNGFVLGGDISESMLNQAIEEYNNISNLTFQYIDAINIKCNEKFDVIVSFNTFHWIKDINALFRSISKNIKCGGTILAMFSIEQYGIGMKIVKELMQSSKWCQYFPWKETDWIFNNREDAINYFSMIPLRSTMNTEIKKLFIDDFVNRYMEKYPAEKDGIYHMIRYEIILIAKKRY